MTRLIWLILLGLMAIPANGARAQDLDRPTCPRCEISIQHPVMLRLEGEDEGSFPDTPSSMAVDSRGRMYFALQSPGELPLVFAPSGRFVQRLGREGDGPGEYRFPRRIMVLPGDTIAVVDIGLRRLSLLTPGYRFVRAQRLVGKTNNVELLSPHHILANAEIATSAAIGFPLHHLDPDGTLIRSFGSANPVLRPNDMYALLRHLVRGDERLIWSITAFYEYRIEAWDSTGKQRAALTRKAEWFPPYRDVLNATPSHPASPSVRSVWVDNDHRLWVMSVVADRNWRRSLGEPYRVEGTQVWPVKNGDQAFDTVIDVIDLQKRSLIASQRLDEVYSLGAAPNKIARIVPTPEGGMNVQVGTLHLVLPQP